MKTMLKGFIFWLIVIGCILGASAIANAIADMITMEMVMKVVYVMLGISLIYIFKK